MNIKTISAFILIATALIVPNIWSNYFYQEFFFPKKTFVEFVTFFCVLALAFEKQLHIPTKKFCLLIAGMFCFRIVSSVLHPAWTTLFSTSEALGFALMCLYFSTVWKERQFRLENFAWVYIVSFFVMIGFSFWQFINFRILSNQIDPLNFSALFGNINMYTEYLLITFPLGIYLLRNTKGFKSLLVSFCVTSAVFWIVFGQSRSTMIGLAFCFAYGVFRKLSWKEWACYGIAGLMYFATWYLPAPAGGFSYGDAKKASFNFRMEMYKGTLKMLKDNPLGIGGEEYEFSYIPYQLSTQQTPQELVRFESPHSEPIKWSIENGWGFPVVSISFWLLLAWQVLKLNVQKDLKTFYLTSFAAMIPQVVFQFLFDDPASFLYIAFVFGLLFAAINTRNLNNKNYFRFIFCILAVAFLAKASVQAVSRYHEGQSRTDKQKLDFGCRIDPTNWRICFYSEMAMISSSFPNDALSTVKQQLRERPFQIHSLRVLGMYYFINGDIDNACKVTKVYDSFYKGNSYFTPLIAEKCAGIKTPVPFLTSEQFNEDYRSWIKNYNQ